MEPLSPALAGGFLTTVPMFWVLNFLFYRLYAMSAYLEILIHVHIYIYFFVFVFLYMPSQLSLQVYSNISMIPPR